MRKINLHCDVLLRNRFTSKSSRQYFSIIKFRGIEQTRHQTSRARRSTTNVTTFAAPLEKSRGTPGRRGTQFGNRCCNVYNKLYNFEKGYDKGHSQEIPKPIVLKPLTW